MHFYDDAVPLASTATFEPPHAPVSDYRKIQAALGLQRTLVVQPTGDGFDNSCTLAGMAALGEVARGIGVVPPDTDEVELRRAALGGGGLQ